MLRIAPISYQAFYTNESFLLSYYNIAIVQSWDPVAVHNDLFHNNVNWGDYHSTLINEEPVTPSKRSISVGLGSGNHLIQPTLATMERFHSSTNFIYYQPKNFCLALGGLS